MNAVTETKASHSSVYAALAVAQSQMGKALKDANKPHFKSKLQTLENSATPLKTISRPC